MPKNWELIRRSKQGSESILVQSVLSYALSDDGHIIYSNGSGAFLLDSDNSVLLFKDALVAEVIA